MENNFFHRPRVGRFWDNSVAMFIVHFFLTFTCSPQVITWRDHLEAGTPTEGVSLNTFVLSSTHSSFLVSHTLSQGSAATIHSIVTPGWRLVYIWHKCHTDVSSFRFPDKWAESCLPYSIYVCKWRCIRKVMRHKSAPDTGGLSRSVLPSLPEWADRHRLCQVSGVWWSWEVSYIVAFLD